MPVQWSSVEVLERLVTAMVASNESSINFHEIARLYGRDMTYFAIENRFRKIKKDAKVMKDEAAGRVAQAPSPATPRVKKTGEVSPTKTGIKTGRITKNKAPAASKLKKEAIENEPMLFGDDTGNDVSFENGDDDSINVEV